MKFLPEVKTFESSQQFHCNSKFMNMEYLPCPSKIPVQNIFWHKKFICYLISKIFAAHFMTNSWLNIGKKIFYLIIYKQKIIQENAFSETSFSTLAMILSSFMHFFEFSKQWQYFSMSVYDAVR